MDGRPDAPHHRRQARLLVTDGLLTRVLELDVHSQTPLWSVCSVLTLRTVACTSKQAALAVRAWLSTAPHVIVDEVDAQSTTGWFLRRVCPLLRSVQIGGTTWNVIALVSGSHVRVKCATSAHAQVLAPFVSANHGIEELRIEGPDGRAAVHGTEWLSKFFNKHIVSVGSSPLPACTVAFGAALLARNARVQCFTACDTDVDEHLLDGIIEAIHRTPTLRTLNLSQNRISNSGTARLAAALEARPGLKEVIAQANGIGVPGGRSLGRLLEAPACSLVELDLWGNELGCDGVVPIARGLAHNKTLRMLSLRSNRVGDTGAKHLGAALATNSCLTKLLLSWNRIADDGAEALAHGLRSNSSLKELNLLENCIGDDGARALRDGLQWNSVLSCCSLQCNRAQSNVVSQIEAWLALIHHDDE